MFRLVQERVILGTGTMTCVGHAPYRATMTFTGGCSKQAPRGAGGVQVTALLLHSSCSDPDFCV